MQENYVVFDFETTGLSPQKNEIIQIGAVKFDRNGEVARFNQLVRPRHSYVSKVISDLTGIFPSDLTEKPTIEQVLPSFLDFIAGHLLVAHNAPFDVSFLYQAIIDCQIREVEHFEVYDTLAEAKRLLKAKSYKLEKLKEQLGLKLRSHDALNDCLITAALYQQLQEIEAEKNVPVPVQGDLFADFEDEDETVTEALRRKLALPITKNLVYFHRLSAKNWQEFDVVGIRIQREYSSGFSLQITLNTGEIVPIHSDFLVQMQKLNFVDEMTKEA